ncbi:RipA family octameric membrane protein [Dendrosporobacter sp. 1207_IL3150]|uniref:RipA family octameric membrane protein n=1 Tax=Dendrosporobacter sp. 1207_IL3150 TaxID=3084054 RepID=UPI002FDAF937
MRIFLIYSFSDKDEVEKIIKEKTAYYDNLHFDRLMNNHDFLWKCFAKRKISKADIILFIVGEHSHKSGNIDWELQEAKKAKKKIYAVKLDMSNFISDSSDPLTIITMPELDSVLCNQATIDRKRFEEVLFNNESPTKIVEDSEVRKVVLEEYKLLLQTSESLIARRQTTNTFFLTANGALLSLSGVIMGFKPMNNYTFIYPLMIAIVGMLLCISWRSLIVSYGQLNKGKFAVLNTIEKYLPVAIFSAEWVALGEGKSKSKYKSFTSSEKDVPLLFLLCYGFVLLVYFYEMSFVKNGVSWICEEFMMLVSK